MSEDPCDEEVKELLEAVLPGWDWVFEDWWQGPVLAKHAAMEVSSHEMMWAEAQRGKPHNAELAAQMNQRARTIGCCLRFVTFEEPARLPRHYPPGADPQPA